MPSRTAPGMTQRTGCRHQPAPRRKHALNMCGSICGPSPPASAAASSDFFAAAAASVDGGGSPCMRFSASDRTKTDRMKLREARSVWLVRPPRAAYLHEWPTFGAGTSASVSLTLPISVTSFVKP